jgi:hypothetical protein
MSNIDDLERGDDTGAEILASFYLTERAEPLLRFFVETLFSRGTGPAGVQELPPEVIRWMHQARALLRMCAAGHMPPAVVLRECGEACPLPPDEAGDDT